MVDPPIEPPGQGDRGKAIDDEIKQMRTELLIYGFAAAKRTAQLLERTSGVMECPMCQQDLRFSVSPSNGHMSAECSTAKCINMIE